MSSRPLATTGDTTRHRADKRLPSGRHGLSRADVESSQRERIIMALFDAVAEKGYPATTIGDVVDRAEVSRRTFYEHFTSKEACFLEAFDGSIAHVGTQLKAVLDTLPKDDWRERVRQSWRAFLTALTTSPNITWSLYIETFSAGPALIERTSAINAGFAAMFRELHRRARKQDPTIPELTPEIFDLYIGGTAERIRHCLRTEGAKALPALEDLFTETALALFGKPAK
ncbi:TetR/AcrR family transcriptional regulator [Actinokineospora iranica]|uniref:DNA-binding transcriptional regulator, AcrR family n=1 Tax=Actinokineospora iranica TaxID=1271860 RepID=A0A1G6JYG6_9PSEU|nr:TetR/AcrR family transcriptional regulator [Actinokineospora iranica]SDC23839.1 DNA-binding transcriptional regulator, AcrR family [Actinokineospora iranica]